MKDEKYLKCNVYLPFQIFEQLRSEAETFGVSFSEHLRSLIILGKFHQGVPTTLPHPPIQHNSGVSGGPHTPHTPPNPRGLEKALHCETCNNVITDEKRGRKNQTTETQNQKSWELQKKMMRETVEKYIREEGAVENYDDELVNELLRELQISPKARYSYTGTSTPKELLLHEIEWLFEKDY
jgi:hypothetical protein